MEWNAMERPKTLHVDKPWGSFDQFVLNHRQHAAKALQRKP